jgi:hypothetical protein
MQAQTKKTPEPNLYDVKVDGKWGFIDNTGKVVVSPQFEELGYGWYEGLMSVKQDGKWGFINDKGKLVIQPEYDRVGTFSEGLCDVLDEDEEEMFSFSSRLGFIDKTGKVVVPFGKYASGLLSEEGFSEGLSVVEVDSKYGYIDKSGNEVIPVQYSWATKFQGGVAAVKDASTDMYGIIDKKGNWITKPGYVYIGSFTNGVAPFITEKDGLNGLINSSGKVIMAPKYRLGGYIYWGYNDEGLAEVHLENKYGYIDNTGAVKIPLKYDKLGSWGEGLISASLDGTVDGEGWLRTVTGGYGFLDKTGKAVISHTLEDASYFSDGLAAAKKDGKWGYIDKTGKWVIEPQFDNQPWGFRNGLAKITYKEGDSYNSPERIGYINKKGAYVWEPQM